jgi:hypothetical protein
VDENGNHSISQVNQEERRRWNGRRRRRRDPHPTLLQNNDDQLFNPRTESRVAFIGPLNLIGPINFGK